MSTTFPVENTRLPKTLQFGKRKNTIVVQNLIWIFDTILDSLVIQKEAKFAHLSKWKKKNLVHIKNFNCILQY